jgi:hypothetical protein|uniref:Uncharacterized protein n=1 Tax=Dechloromonas aromatica (strain RCB) TaxID=159087 RepID=Q47DL7_DECAR
MKIACAAALIAGFTAPVLADEMLRAPVSDPRPVMLAALRSVNGEAHGILSGEIAEALTQRFAATSPIYIDVTTEKRYTHAGCARLNVRLWQDGVLLPGASSPRRQTMDFGINYCLDGQPPQSLK